MVATLPLVEGFSLASTRHTPNRTSVCAPSDDATLEMLMERVARGDQQAFELFYNRTSKLVHTVCLRILRHREDAEEAALDAFTHVWTHAADFNPRRGRAVAWIVTIARSRSIDRVRWRTSRRTEALEAGDDVAAVAPTPEQRFLSGEEAAAVRRALDRVPAEQRAILELASGLGLTHRELAATLGLPLGTVKTRARLGLRRLRLELEQCEK